MPLPVVRQGGFRESDAPADQILTRAQLGIGLELRVTPTVQPERRLQGALRQVEAPLAVSTRSTLEADHLVVRHEADPMLAVNRCEHGDDLQTHLAQRGGHLRADEAHADYHGTRTRLGDLTDRSALSMVRCLPCAKRILLSHEKQGVEPYCGFS